MASRSHDYEKAAVARALGHLGRALLELERDESPRGMVPIILNQGALMVRQVALWIQNYCYDCEDAVHADIGHGFMVPPHQRARCARHQRLRDLDNLTAAYPHWSERAKELEIKPDGQ